MADESPVAIALPVPYKNPIVPLRKVVPASIAPLLIPLIIFRAPDCYSALKSYKLLICSRLVAS
jgi:hypothetical protein